MAEAEVDFLTSGLLSRPALDAIRFESLGLSTGTAMAFGFKSVPCCFLLQVLLLLIGSMVLVTIWLVCKDNRCKVV